MKDLYTFIMEYAGGTYVSQIKAFNINEAQLLWLTNLDVENIDDFTEKNKLLKSNEIDDEPVLLL